MSECHLFFKKLIDEKNDKVNFYIIRKTNEEHISVTYGCVRFIDCIRFSSNSLDSIFKTLVDNSHETLKNLKEEIVGNDDIIKIVNETGEEDGTINDLEKNYPDEFGKLEKGINSQKSGNDLKNLKSEFPDKVKYLKQ